MPNDSVETGQGVRVSQRLTGRAPQQTGGMTMHLIVGAVLTFLGIMTVRIMIGMFLDLIHADTDLDGESGGMGEWRS
ncbi:hypothetical protein CSQ85_11825 [Bifidobacterium rousetti]|uniref:hypothetical protein n=1 Tax=Bifidobacterium rousetti TaxID=2045439 RepID=UPI00123BBE65|nr:hypothetical protein [Bifidobacterium rousetti]KAA8816108.1 hypothetical protein CSQ85_11825 [Bifidobacterium rousetti]